MTRTVCTDLYRTILAAVWALRVADYRRISAMTGIDVRLVARAAGHMLRRGWLITLRDPTGNRPRWCLLSDEGHAVVCGGAG